MNIRKTLLLTLIIAIALLGLTLAGCEKHDHPTAEHPEAKACCGEDPSKCCASKVAEEAEDVAEEAEATAEEAGAAVDKAISEHPTEHPE